MSNPLFPDLRTLHVRHPGLTVAVCHAYAEAAQVCLSRHHLSPVDLVVHGDDTRTFILVWEEASQRQRRAWANLTDAVEAGAYALATAAMEAMYRWSAIARAETLTGADYYVGPLGADLETAYRLEISGVDSGDENALRARQSRKAAQVREGRSSLPALVCVVGFRIRSILVSKIRATHDGP